MSNRGPSSQYYRFPILLRGTLARRVAFQAETCDMSPLTWIQHVVVAALKDAESDNPTPTEAPYPEQYKTVPGRR